MRQVLFFCLERARVWWPQLKAWASPRRNPFVAQALRAEARRSLAVRLAFWFGMWFVAAWASAVWMESAVDHEVEVPVVGAQTAIGLAWVWALWLARFRLGSALRKEWLKERLIPILLSRLSPEEVAALSGAPATLLGVFVSALALPAWALGWGMGFLTPLDAWGYALLLIAACAGFPSWSSAAWEARLNARTSATATGKTNNRKAASSSTASTGTSVWAALLLSAFPIVAALFYVAPQAFVSSFETWVTMWPGEIRMLFGHFYAFPLLLARLLAYPLPFFAASLPLWVALAPFWVNGLRHSHANLSCALEARRDSGEKRARRIAAIWRPIRGWWAPLMAGFALPVAYESDWLAAWRGATPMFPSKWGVEADVTLSWWHIVVALGAFTLSIWLRMSAAQREAESQWPVVWERFKKLARRVGAGVFVAGIFGPLGCGHNPLPAPVALFGVQMALVAGTWLLLQIAFARRSSMGGAGTNGFGHHPVLRWLVPLWLSGGPMLLAVVPFALSWGTAFISPISWPYCLLSPVTMWFAPRFEFSLASPLFYGAAGFHLALAGALYWRAQTLLVPDAKTLAPRKSKAQRQAIIKRAARRQAASQTRTTIAAPEQTLAQARQNTVAAPEQTLADARQNTVAALARVLEARQGAPEQALAEARRTTVVALQEILEARQGAPEQTLAQARRGPARPLATLRAQFIRDSETATEKVAVPDAGNDDALEINTPQTAALRTATRVPLPTPSPEQERFLERFARFDNALLRLELRRAMGKIEWTTSARTGAGVGAGLIVFFSILIPVIVIGFSLLIGAGPRAGAGSPTFTDMEWMFCAAAVLGLWITSLEICQRTSALYDRDRLDGSLDFLFLTPLQTREIVAGKIGPPLVRGTCFLAAFWPSLLTIALLLSLGGDHRLWPFAAVLPLVAWALTARAIAWLHLVGVAKPNSKLVYCAAIGGFCALPLLAFVSGIIAFDVLSPSTWQTPAVLLLLLLTALCLLDCLWPYNWSVRVLERERVRH
jgi:hypothetical protein